MNIEQRIFFYKIHNTLLYKTYIHFTIYVKPVVKKENEIKYSESYVER